MSLHIQTNQKSVLQLLKCVIRYANQALLRYISTNFKGDGRRFQKLISKNSLFFTEPWCNSFFSQKSYGSSKMSFQSFLLISLKGQDTQNTSLLQMNPYPKRNSVTPFLYARQLPSISQLAFRLKKTESLNGRSSSQEQVEDQLQLYSLLSKLS